MQLVYVLTTDCGGRYVGHCAESALLETLEAHNLGEFVTTRSRAGAWELAHYWEIPTWLLASALKRYLVKAGWAEVFRLVQSCAVFGPELHRLALSMPTTQLEISRSQVPGLSYNEALRRAKML